MEALIALIIGVLTACGVYLTLRARTFPVVLGLTFLSKARAELGNDHVDGRHEP
ncbi:MAG: hypothetical protein MUC53_16085 [Candidatus Contendobacter sp.]|nr:hypothetical protein [Candidatus Contendobacter sp.]